MLIDDVAHLSRQTTVKIRYPFQEFGLLSHEQGRFSVCTYTTKNKKKVYRRNKEQERRRKGGGGGECVTQVKRLSAETFLITLKRFRIMATDDFKYTQRIDTNVLLSIGLKINGQVSLRACESR